MCVPLSNSALSLPMGGDFVLYFLREDNGDRILPTGQDDPSLQIGPRRDTHLGIVRWNVHTGPNGAMTLEKGAWWYPLTGGMVRPSRSAPMPSSKG